MHGPNLRVRVADVPTADEFSLRSIALPAFGPTAVWSVGVGAAVPVVALSARDLGASVALAAARRKPFACATLEPDCDSTRLILANDRRDA